MINFFPHILIPYHRPASPFFFVGEQNKENLYSNVNKGLNDQERQDNQGDLELTEQQHHQQEQDHKVNDISARQLISGQKLKVTSVRGPLNLLYGQTGSKL